ncbi:uncharacterized protein KY384_002572 [Bacidia gigantensis]|uniref:uncharacterized protein n=1 Tax=Bacidia gigantensis TaxID=2732470 RepID=UPI001D05A720|nr:uncharacterized protein KY384_002572 [Bacidia gigantensis]KAG8532695.1 hypothetical protein KY384_002572 [Bacidia gigantensis]
MSRHKFVKALNLDDELDEYDGALDEDVQDEYSPEDKEQLRRGTVQVRQTLGLEFPASDREIEDSLYYYYYDVSKTVNYLLNLGMEIASSYPVVPVCRVPFSAAEFFRDAPWLNIPLERRGEITVEPLLPPCRLLGGSSKEGSAPPRSKLAALAAARKRENRNPKSDGPKPSSVIILEKLSRSKRLSASDELGTSDQSVDPEIQELAREPNIKRYPVRSRRKSTTPPAQDESIKVKSATTIDTQDQSVNVPSKLAPSAPPSMFGTAMFAIDSSFERWNKASDDRPNLHLWLRLPTNHDAFAGPSPDDVVLKAQSASKGPKQSTKQISYTKGATKIPAKDDPGGVTTGLSDVKVAEEVPKIKRKNIDVVAEYAKLKPKKAANFVVIGHVDAGKSTLMGRLLHDLKAVDQRTVDKYRREAEKIGKASFALAWVMDQGSEERARGVTIDIANFKFETEKTNFTILDAPGHRDFVPNMIAGASQADFAILVIDASTGNFESGLRGQTKEHTLLVRSIGVQSVIIAVNKLDTVGWSRDRFNEISQQLTAFLTTAGFQSRNLAFVPCSGLTGDNIINKASCEAASWYEGKPLIGLLEDSEPSIRAIEKPFRLTIDNVFRGGVQNPVSVSGRIDAGTLQIGDSLLIHPASQTATVKLLEVDNESAEWAIAGQNANIHLSDIDANYLRPGDLVSLPSAPVRITKAFTVKILAFEHIMPMPCEIHRGRLYAPGRVVKLEAILDKASGTPVKGKKPKLVKPGSVARVSVETDQEVPLESGNRVILRAEGVTIGAGLVE